MLPLSVTVSNVTLLSTMLLIAGCGAEKSEVQSKTIPPASAPTQSATKPPENPTTALQQTLEQALQCAQSPKPIEIVSALQREDIIQTQAIGNIDSVSYFPVKKPFEVWGLQVTHVYGFDQNPKIFERGPGTAPPIVLGVIVPYSEEETKKRMSSKGSKAMIRDFFLADLIESKIKQPSTEIQCEEIYK